MKAEREKIGHFLRGRREQMGLTEIQLAKMLEKKEETVKAWEKGEKMPERGILESLARCLQVEMADIIMGEKVIIPEGGLPVEEMDEIIKKLIRWFL